MNLNRRCAAAQCRLGTRAVPLFIAALMSILVATQADAAAITIAWDRNNDGVTAGYYVYYGTQSGSYSGYVDVGGSTTAIINTPDSTTPYYFAVQAYSSSGDRSQYSAEVVWQPATPAAQAPTLSNPGSITNVVGQTVTLQLSATDPAGLALQYAATGLPAGLSVASPTGRISGTPTTAGAYSVVASVTNTAGLSASQSFTWSILSQPVSQPPKDVTPPTLKITSPTSGATYTTKKDRVVLSGTAADDVGVVQISWSSDRGDRGTASGTSSWTTDTVKLRSGRNVLTVTAADAAGSIGTVTLTVTRGVGA
jgi:Putative Ig domain/Bacterial Ig domain